MSSVKVTAVAYHPDRLPAAARTAATPVLGPGPHTATALGTPRLAWRNLNGDRVPFWVGRYEVTTDPTAAADAVLADIDAAIQETK